MPPRFNASQMTVPGAAVRTLRAFAGWSQKQLAVAAGLTRSQLQSYEAGRVAPPIATLQRMVTLMGLPPHHLEAALVLTAEGRAPARRRSGGRTDAASTPETAELAASAENTTDELNVINEIAARAGADATRFTRDTLTEMVERFAVLAARRQAPRLWARLRRYSERVRLTLVREAKEFRGWALCEAICLESERTAADDPRKAIALGELAVEVAARSAGPEGWRPRLEGYARAFLANAVRAAGRPREAAEIFDRAKEIWSSASAEAAPLDGSRLLDLEASLRRDQRRVAEALALLDQALALHPGGPEAGRLRLNRGNCLEELGDHEGAIAELREAAALVDAEAEPRLLLIVLFNRAHNLFLAGRSGEAQEMLPGVRALARRLGNRIDLVRLRWLEGKVAGGLGRGREAIAAFEEVCAAFTRLAMPYDAALATLHLAAAHLAEARPALVKALAAEAAPVLEAEGIHAEARKALALFRQAAAQQALTFDLTRRLAAYLEQARRNPELAFEAAA